MEFTSLFDEASRDLEAEGRERIHTAASQEASQACWPFLALAQSEAEFGHRLALMEDRLTSIASRHGVPVEDLVGPLQSGFTAVLEAKTAAYRPGDRKSRPGRIENEDDWAAYMGDSPALTTSQHSLPRGRHLVEYNEWGGVKHSVPVSEYYDQMLPHADASGWKYDEDEHGVHATGPEGTYHRYELYPSRRSAGHEASKQAAGLKCSHCGHSASDHVDGKACDACFCTDFTPRTTTASLADATVPGEVADDIDKAPSEVLETAKDALNITRQPQVMVGSHKTADNDNQEQPSLAGEIAHGVGHGIGTAVMEALPDLLAAASLSEARAFDHRVAMIRQALEEGVDPLALISEVNRGGAPGAAMHHDTVQQFAGGSGSALDAAMAEGGNGGAAGAQPSHHDTAPAPYTYAEVPPGNGGKTSAVKQADPFA